MSVTIHDLARLAGLNPSTISRALRNDPRVRQSTRDKIHSLARKYGYTPNLNARNLADGRTRMIAFLMGTLDFQLGREAADTLNELLSQHGYTLLILSYAPDAERFYADRLEKLTQKICDGVILTAPDYRTQTPELLQLLKAVKVPLVCLDRWFRDFPLPTVTTDNSIALHRLCECALNAGMDGAIVSFPIPDTVSEDRRRETIQILQKKNIPYLLSDRADDIAGFLRRNNIRKPALFSNTFTAEPPWESLLPRGFITAAFDRNPVQKQLSGPQFLCIQDYRRIAVEAAQLLLEQLGQGTPAAGRHLIPPCEIITIPPV